MPSRGEPLTGYNKRCPVCGKEFWAFGDWSFTRRDRGTKRKIYYCSWKCFRLTEEKKAEKPMIQIRFRCLICGKTEPEWDSRKEEEIRNCVCGECKESVLFVRKVVEMIEERKG